MYYLIAGKLSMVQNFAEMLPDSLEAVFYFCDILGLQLIAMHHM